jgi:hypothetical protein
MAASAEPRPLAPVERGRSTPRAHPGTAADVPVSGRGRLPDFYVVGHQKCGTTALYLMLRRHPQIFMPDIKEPRFFAPDLRSRFADRISAPGRPRTLEQYLALFAAATPGQRIGDASPQYLRSREAPGRIAQARPDARIVAILREPASFLRSFHLQMVSSNVETRRDMRRALSLEDARRRGRRIPRRCHHPEALLYSDHVRYVEQLRRFHEVFGREQVLVLIYDDLRADNEATVRRVLRFLGVRDTVPVAPVQTKPVKAVRAMPLHRMANALRVARTTPANAGGLARVANALTPQRLLSEDLSALWRRLAYTQPRPPSEEYMRGLRRRFRGEVVALSEYLGRDLVSEWGYGDIG